MQTEVKRREIQGREVKRHAWMFIGGCSSPLAQWVVWSSPAISHDGATRHPPLHKESEDGKNLTVTKHAGRG